jgi:fibronectin type 3 domain-containing protein
MIEGKLRGKSADVRIKRLSGVVAEENIVAKFANIRDTFSLVLMASLLLISGCVIGNKSASGSQSPTPTATAHSVAITWQASPSTNLQGYKVYRGQTSGGPYTSIAGTLAASVQQFTDSSVLSGQAYFYVITSIDLNGLESAPSPEVSAQIPTP